MKTKRITLHFEGAIDKQVESLLTEKGIKINQYVQQLVISDVLMHALRAGKRASRTRL